MELITEILSMLGTGISSLGQNIATGVGDTAKALFITTTGTGADAVSHLSTFGVIIVTFAAVGLAVGITKFVMHFICSLGGKSY